jgi:hypothetical protein
VTHENVCRESIRFAPRWAVALTSNALTIVDATESSNAVIRSTIALGSSRDVVAASNGVVYAGSLGSSGVDVIDATNPDAPVVLGQWAVGASDMAFVGDHLVHSRTLNDVSTNPLAPVRVRSLASGPFGVWRIAAGDGRVVAALNGGSSQSWSIQVHDVDPPSPSAR